MTKAEYLRLKSTLDFKPSIFWISVTLCVHVGTVALGGWLVLEDGVRWIGIGLLALAAFQGFAIVHECGHGSFSSSRGFNVLVGHLASILALTPYWPWTYIHTQHHVWAGHLHNDPAVVTLARWRKQGEVPLAARVAWRAWLPVIAFSQLVIFATYPLRMLQQGKLSRGKAVRSAASVFVTVVPHAVFLAITGAWADWLVFLALYLFITELVNVPHHVDRPMYTHKLAVWEQAEIARSCVYPRWLAWALTFQFNLHAEHHVFPTLPWYRLPSARMGVKQLAGPVYTESRGGRWILKNRLRSLTKVALRRR